MTGLPREYPCIAVASLAVAGASIAVALLSFAVAPFAVVAHAEEKQQPETESESTGATSSSTAQVQGKRSCWPGADQGSLAASRWHAEASTLERQADSHRLGSLLP